MDRATETLRDVVIDLEHRFWEASTDADFYRDNALPDAILVFAGGFGLVAVDEVIEMVEANTVPWATYELRDIHVVEGVDSVVVSYTARARKAGSDDEFRVHASSVYMQFGDAWKLALHQQTLA